MKKIVLLVVFMSVLLQGTAQADSANPPVLDGLKQITTGPYWPGKLIQFQLSTHGGSPGLESIQISSPCITGTIWSAGLKPNPNFYGTNLVTGEINGTCGDGNYSIESVKIADMTSLATTAQGTQVGVDGNFVIVHKITEPTPGEVRPNLKPDQIMLGKLPAKTSGKIFQIDLPRLSINGQGLKWILVWGGKSTCNIVRDFPFDWAGKLIITGKGPCIFGASPIPQSLIFGIPKIVTTWAQYGSDEFAYFVKQVIK